MKAKLSLVGTMLALAFAGAGPANFVANASPTLTITSPADGTVVSEGSNVVVSASVTDAGGTVTNVDFYNGFNLLGSSRGQSFALTLTNVAAGDYTFLARATDDQGVAAHSAPISLTVEPANHAPVVAFDQPFDGAIFIQPSNIQLVATAIDSDGQVATVEFVADNQTLAAAKTTNTYSAAWSNPEPGTHSLSVKATDDLGATTIRQMIVTVADSNSVLPAPLLPSNTNRPTLWVPDGPVNTLLETNGVLYVGGSFNNIGQLVPGSAVVEVSSSSPDLSYPLIDGGVDILIGDGEGGYYVGGLFNAVGDFARTNLAHVLADKTVDLDFRADANGHVEAMALLGDTLFVGGEFTQIGGQSHRYLAALDKQSGALKNWDANPDDWVSALAATNNTVYAGGNFRNLGGQPRSYIGAVDATTALATSWNPSADGFITQLEIVTNRLYAVGAYQRINSQLRNGLASLDLATGAPTSFNQIADGGAKIIRVVGNTVFVGGAFTRMGGTARNNLAALDGETGSALAWNPDAEGSVEAMAVLGNTLYIAGAFTQISGQPRNRFAALDKDSGALLDLDLNASGRIFSLTESAGKILGGGPLGLIRLPRKGLAAIDAATGFATTWDAQCDGAVFALAARGNTLYVGGGFSQLGGQTRNSLGAVDMTTALATPWDPGPATGVRALAIAESIFGDELLVGGDFGGLANQFRNSIAAVDLQSGSLLPWNPNADGMVRSITASSNLVYVGGNFAQVGGQPRNGVAALNLFTGKATGWNPNVAGAVSKIALSDKAIYVAGYFTQIGGKPRVSLAALDPVTGSATGWSSDANGSVLALGVAGDLVYAGGQFTQIGGQSRTNAVALDRRFSPSNATEWSPEPASGTSSSRISAIEITSSTIYLGGDFTMVDGRSSPYLAAFDLPGRAELPLQLPNGLFQVNLIGPLGRVYVFEASTNLSDWTPVFTNRAPFVFQDVEAINYQQRFYRAVPAQ